MTRRLFFRLTSLNLMTGPSAAVTDTTATSADTAARLNARSMTPPGYGDESEVESDPCRPHRAIVGGEEAAGKSRGPGGGPGRSVSAGRRRGAGPVAKVHYRIAIAREEYMEMFAVCSLQFAGPVNCEL